MKLGYIREDGVFVEKDEQEAYEVRESFPTVGDLLDYIEQHNIPRDAKLVVERVRDKYIEQYEWTYYPNDTEDGDDLLPIHNWFGWIEDKKYFVLWMHY